MSKYLFLALSSCLSFCTQTSPRISFRTSTALSALAEKSAGPYSLKSKYAAACDKWPATLNAFRMQLNDTGVLSQIAAKSEKYLATLAGCAGWFELTDENVGSDFDKIAASIGGDTRLHCISTGYVQPWFMLAKLNCESLTIVDISPTMLVQQERLLAEMLKKRSSFNFGKYLKGETFSYPISRKNPKPVNNQTLTVAAVCGSEAADCADLFSRAAKKISHLRKIDFVWGNLADAVNKDEKISIPAVFYTSNALDPQFSTKSEFKELNARYAMATAGKGLIIYHMASTRKFAVYRCESAQKVTILCSDPFMVVPEPIRDPCYPKPVQPAPYEMLTWADELGGIRPAAKDRKSFCTQYLR